MRRGLCLRLLFVASLPARGAGAQPPTIVSTSPQAAKPGETIDVKIQGGNLAGAAQLWASFPATITLPTEIAGNGTSAGEVVYRVQIAPDVPPGVEGLRVATPQGVSNLKLFVIDDLASVAQVRPNQLLGQAQQVALPAAVDGRLDGLARDYYKFAVAAGQRVSFEVLARRLGSPLDPMIRLLDLRGRELAYSDDALGLEGDSQLCHTFAEAGEYVVELRDIRFQGGPNYFYRLRMGDFPCVTAAFPMGVKRGVAANVGFAGPGAALAQAVPINLHSDSPLNWLNVGARLVGGRSSGFALVSVGAGDEALEVEPNNEPAQATRVNLGANLNGRFDPPGDIDRFVFAAKAGQHFLFVGVTRSQGSPSDLYLRLLKADGGEVAAAEDTGANDGVIDYTFPADGDYTLAVEDLHRRGGIEFAYRIAVQPFEERFTLAAATDTLNIAQGGLASIVITANRGKFAGPIELALANAPEGFSATPCVIGPGRTFAALTVRCAPNVAPGKVQHLQIVGVSQLGGADTKVLASAADVQKAAFNGLPWPPPILADQIAVGVAPAPLFALATNVPELVFGKDLSATVKVSATRTPNFAEEIALALLPEKDALPAGVTAALKPIAKGTNDIEIVFTANNQAPLGQFSVVLNGTGKQGATAVAQPIPALQLQLKPPFALKPDFGGGVLEKGKSLKIKVVAERNPAYAGPIALSFQNLPAGVAAAAATIPQGQNEIEVELTAAQDAAAAAVQNVVVQGEGMSGAAKLPAAAPPASLTVK